MIVNATGRSRFCGWLGDLIFEEEMGANNKQKDPLAGLFVYADLRLFMSSR